MEQKDVKNCFHAMTPTAEQKERMLLAIRQAQGKRARARRTKALIAMAAAILLCLAATLALAAVFRWDERLIEYLRPTQRHMEDLTPAVDAPLATTQASGATVTVRQTIADGQSIYVLYEVTLPAEMEFTDDLRFEEEHFRVALEPVGGRRPSGGYGSVVLEQSANKRTSLLQYYSTAKIKNSRVRLTLSNLCRRSRNESGMYVLAPFLTGEWILEWNIRYENIAKTYPAKIPLSINGSINEIESVVISPISVCLYVTGDDITFARPVVTFKNGGTIAYDLHDPNASIGYSLGLDGTEEDGVYTNIFYCRFDRTIDITEVESVTIDGVTIPIGTGA